MVGSSKILTVSYGTFSCTLEGFDESFDTMKAIAEYFRDLAADDRYFGAEPPTPDAEMLARIAEKEITRRVEARMETSGIVLRPAAALASQQATQSAPESAPELDVAGQPAPTEAPAEVAAEPQIKAEAAPVMPPPVEAEPVIEPVAPPAPAADGVAAKLQRIRAVVGKSAQQPTTDYIEDIHANAPSDDFDLTSVLEASEDTSADQVFDEVEAEVETVEAEAPEAEVDDSDVADFGALDEETPEDATEEAFDHVEETVIGTITTPEAIEDDAENEVIDEDPAAFADEEDAPQVEADEVVEEVAETTDVAAEVEDAPEAVAEEVSEAEVDEEPAPQPVTPRRTRVIRVKRADFERAVSEGDLEEVNEEDTPVLETAQDAPQDALNLAELDGLDDINVEADSTLSDEEEAEFLAQLADIDDDGEEDAQVNDLSQNAFLMDDDLEEEDDVEISPQVLRPRRALLDNAADESDMSRLLDRTDEQLSAPEHDQRRRNLAHLKAAVAATEAARRMGEDSDKEAEAERNRFRNDLSEAVRPTRPVAGGVQPRRATPSERRSERPRSAPLKLVASQRIDVPTEASVTQTISPVRPRRVSSAELATETALETASSFAEYAEEVGANDLPDLLEAAAAYTSYVEGLEDFSRPQVMKKVREVLEDDSFNREDGLRVFGTLLREGRISKVRNGRFQVSEQTRFKPAANG